MLKDICSKLSLSAANLEDQMPFLCRPCLWKVERLITLKTEVHEVQAHLDVLSFYTYFD